MQVQEKAKEFRQVYGAVKTAIQQFIVGHEAVIDGVLSCLFADGHVLLEGVPGLGKTYLVRRLSEALDLQFRRIQFTPDLMPADIMGTNMVTETETGERSFHFQRGPVFTNVLLADEINRATPKTQSALLEAMQERSVTVAGTTYLLDPPFIVLATQNPIEMEGTYPLPEAQLDRFMLKLLVETSSKEELITILDRTTEGAVQRAEKVADGKTIVDWRAFVRDVVAAPHVKDYAARLVLATHPGNPFATEVVKRYLRYGASPRGAQVLISCAKVRALLDERYNVGFSDVASLVLPALRHRLILNFEGEAEGISTDEILGDVLAHVPTSERDASPAKSAQSPKGQVT
ncbi:MAG: AAA family ATPase [Planctomycetota bacterium]